MPQSHQPSWLTYYGLEDIFEKFAIQSRNTSNSSQTCRLQFALSRETNSLVP